MRCYTQNQKYQKSALETYSNTTQTINPSIAGGAAVNFTNVSTDTGCSIASQNGGAEILCSGLYEITVDATFTLVTTPGTVTVQLYQNGVPLPCAQASVSMIVDDVDSVSFSTRMCVNTCQASHPSYTVVFTSDAVTELNVTHVALGIVRQA